MFPSLYIIYIFSMVLNHFRVLALCGVIGGGFSSAPIKSLARGCNTIVTCHCVIVQSCFFAVLIFAPVQLRVALENSIILVRMRVNYQPPTVRYILALWGCF